MALGYEIILFTLGTNLMNVFNAPIISTLCGPGFRFSMLGQLEKLDGITVDETKLY